MDFRITSIKTSNVTFDWALDMMEKQSVVITAKIVNDVLIEIRRFSVVTPGEQFVNNRETHFFVTYSQEHGEYNEYIDGVLWAQPVLTLSDVINDYADCCCHFSNKEE